MRRLAFVLRPGWVILALVVVAFAYLCFAVLAPWQLGKNSATSERNQLIADSVRADPVPLTTLAPHDEWRQVTVPGRYLPDTTVLVRLRVVDNAPAFEVLTAFRMDDGRTVLINRGSVAPVGSVNPAPPAAQTLLPPAGSQTLHARIRTSEGVTPGRDPLVNGTLRQVYSIDSTQVGNLIGVPLLDGYLQLDGGQPGVFTPVALPQLDAGPYLSYGLQWLAFGIMAPLALAYFVRSELRERRKTRPSSVTTTEDKLADRYGRRR